AGGGVAVVSLAAANFTTGNGRALGVMAQAGRVTVLWVGVRAVVVHLSGLQTILDAIASSVLVRGRISPSISHVTLDCDGGRNDDEEEKLEFHCC
ncbi:hypothetical protein PMAYCL1PPCAC_11189, partial [Pristionchus mayeri]